MTSNFEDSPRYFAANIVPSGEKLSPVIDTNPTNPHYHMPHPPPDPLSWQRFYTLCGQPANEQPNKIRAQLRCSHLDGMPVAWEGTVSAVQIVHVTNPRADYIARYLPRWLANLVRCLLGERISDQLECAPNATADHLCGDLQRLLKTSHLQGKCSLHRWNRYEYEIRVRVSSGGLLSKSADVILQAGDIFGNFTRRLTAGDRLHFHGTLFNSRIVPQPQHKGGASVLREDFVLGASHAQVQVTAVECLVCQDKALLPVSVERVVKSPVDARLRDLMRGIKYLLNVLLNPLITFK